MKEYNEFAKKVYDVVKAIPSGKVMCYGQVALAAGYLGAARAVGRALHNNPDPLHIPCHRVVFADGRCTAAFAFGGVAEHQDRLKAEGVEFEDNKVLKKHFYQR